MTMEQSTELALARGWRAVRGLVTRFADALIPGGLLRAPARRETLILLRQAEALVRRALLLMALTEVLPVRTAPRETDPDALARLRDLPKPQRLAFPLTEPQPSALALWYEVTEAGDEVVADTPARALTMPSDDDAFVDPGTLVQRFQRLEAVLEQPKKDARRMARWLERQRAGRKTGATRTNPLRLGHPPTVTKARRQKHPVSTQALIDLHYFTRSAFDSS
ncbi:MAG: hypothetical protein QNI84_03575 [Henriciella sp.]|nr:hypothetical protein [Henriciella sp.]